GRPSDWFSEEDLAQVVLQQERVGDTKTGEHADDIAVEQHGLASARGRIGAVLQVPLVGDDELRVVRIVVRVRGGAKEAEQRAVRAQDAGQLGGQLLRRAAIEVVDEI